MKLTEEQKQKINAYFESKSEEEVTEILKGYGIEVPEKQSVEERPIGDIFEFEGTKLKVVKSKTSACSGCYFAGGCRRGITGYCAAETREDGNCVIFEKVED